MVFRSPHSVIVGQQILDRRHAAFLPLEETDDEQQYRRANRGHDDRAEQGAGNNAQHVENKLADEIVSEPVGGAHTDYQATADNLKKVIVKNLKALKKIPSDELMKARYDKFRAMGVFEE